MSKMSWYLSNTESAFANESKHYNMVHFITAVSEYLKTRAEDSSNIINRNLQLLSVTIDFSIFDPNTSVVCEFFVSLHELLSNLDPRSALAWSCIGVLGAACKNTAARYQLIHTYQFIPAVSRLLGDHLNPEKKIKVLTVMQELSYGLKISWQIPHLSQLMSTLTCWINKNTEHEQVTTLALGVLVNLCYKNIPAIYTLSRCVDIKRFIRGCTTLTGANIEVNVCKLLIVLDYVHGVVTEETFKKLMHVTFKSIKEAFEANDPILLRHVVEFFLDVKEQNDKTKMNSHDALVVKYEGYHVAIEQLLDVVDNNVNDAAGDASSNNPECMSSILKFLHAFIDLKLAGLEPLYPRFIKLSLHWIQTELACSEALTIIRTVAVISNLHDASIFDPLVSSLPLFLSGLQNIDQETIMNIEHCKRLKSVIELFRALLQVEATRSRVLEELKEELLGKVFVPLIGSTSPRSRVGDANNFTPEAVLLYIQTLVLIHEMARYSSQWVEPVKHLVKHRQIQAILAEALYNGNSEIKGLILNMAASPLFPIEQIAVAMAEVQPMIMKSEPQSPNNANIQNIMCYPLMSVAQSEKLDDTITVLKEACQQNNFVNIATSDVMELYEYKLASTGHAERAAVASAEAASQRCIHLQHQTAQQTTEISRVRQLLIHTQQCTEELHRDNKHMEENIKLLNNRLEAEKGRHKVTHSQLAQQEKIVKKHEAELERLKEQLEEKERERVVAEESNVKMKGLLHKLEENLKRQEKNSEKKDDMIKKANATIDHYKLQTVQMERQLKQGEHELTLRSEELSVVKEQLAEKINIIDSITKLAISR